MFEHPRLIYTNKFSQSGTAADIIDLTTREKLG
jgi:hypothetical protein